VVRGGRGRERHRGAETAVESALLGRSSFQGMCGAVASNVKKKGKPPLVAGGPDAERGGKRLFRKDRRGQVLVSEKGGNSVRKTNSCGGEGLAETEGAGTPLNMLPNMGISVSSKRGGSKLKKVVKKENSSFSAGGGGQAWATLICEKKKKKKTYPWNGEIRYGVWFSRSGSPSDDKEREWGPKARRPVEVEGKNGGKNERLRKSNTKVVPVKRRDCDRNHSHMVVGGEMLLEELTGFSWCICSAYHRTLVT